MRAPSDEKKREQGRGTGEREYYKPWIMAREVPSNGLCRCPIDIYTHRQMQLLSLVEADLYYLLRWDTKNYDIREQFPLRLEDTQRICAASGIRHIKRDHKDTPFTTDLLCTRTDGVFVAYSCKKTSQLSNREKEKLYVEKTYWNEQGVNYILVTHAMINKTYADNIREVFFYFDGSYVRDDVQFLKHRIARREIPVDMTQPIDYDRLMEKWII